MKNHNIPFAIITLVVVLPLAACKRSVSLKQDTPQATVASLIKVYEAQEFRNLEDLIDPLFLKAKARNAACRSEAGQYNACVLRARDCLRQDPDDGRNCPTIDDCSSADSCWCGEKGDAAVERVGAFDRSSYHRALLNSKMNAAGCSITEAKMGPDAHVAYNQAYCREKEPKGIYEDENYSTVRFRCEDREFGVVLRKAENSWRLVGFDSTTDTHLEQLAAHIDRHDTLNEDLK